MFNFSKLKTNKTFRGIIMKQKRFYVVLFPLLIFFIEFFSCKIIIDNYGKLTHITLDFVLKQLFMYHRKNTLFFSSIDWLSYISLFSCYLISLFFIGIFLYGTNKKYRSFIIMRFHNYKNYLRFSEYKSLVPTFFLIILIK